MASLARLPRLMDAHRLQILLVAASDEDLTAVREKLGETGAAIDLHVARDAAEARDFLLQDGLYAEATRPDLVVLDVDLEGNGAAELLSSTQGQEELAHLQIVAIIGEDAEPSDELIADPRLHETLRRPIDGDTLRRAVAYFSEL
jgi:CheY-like chemotaxis protein